MLNLAFGETWSTINIIKLIQICLMMFFEALFSKLIKHFYFYLTKRRSNDYQYRGARPLILSNRNI